MKLRTIIVFALLPLVFACSNDREDIGENNSCGTLRNGEIFRDIDEELGILVDITSVTGGNLVTIREVGTGNLGLMVLAAVELQTNPRKAAQAEEFALMEPFNVRFFRAQEDCTTDVQGLSEVVPGQLFLENGEDLAEQLIIRDLVTFSQDDSCESQLLRNCYQALVLEGNER